MSEPITCVLGMHRSGTSLTTRLLSLLGIELGAPERLVRSAPDNPTGFWEHAQIVRLNQRVLDVLGASWCDPPAGAPGWERSTRLVALRDEARTLVDEELARAVAWGFKDPRTCLTLAFWRSILPDMRYVLCLRAPDEVARSLQRRDGLSTELGLYLWLSYLRASLHGSSGQARVLVRYEDVLRNPQLQAARLATFLQRPEAARDPRVQAAVRTFVDDRLRHHRSHGPRSDLEQLASQVYRVASEPDALHSPRQLETLMARALEAVTPVVQQQRRAAADSFHAEVRRAAHAVDAITRGARFVLVDEAQWPLREHVPGLCGTPFIERHGEYDGPPADDAAAIAELERQRAGGARFVIIGRPAFWWLEHYAQLNLHLHAHYRAVSRSDLLIAFELGAN